MPNEIYLQLSGIEGEVQTKSYDNFIQVLEYSHEMIQNTSNSAPVRGTTGNVNHKDIRILKYVDKSSPKLYAACSTGKHIDDGKLDFLRAAGDDKVKYLEIKLKDVIISRVAPAAAARSDEFPQEYVDLNYGEIEWTYSAQKRTGGSASGNVNAKYNVVKAASA